MTGIRAYLVECYSPGINRGAVESTSRRATTASIELRSRGRQVDYLGALLLPADEVVFHLFAAGSPGPVHEAGTRAGIEFERVLESIPIGIDSLVARSARSDTVR
jgi:hypothetical protein